MPDVMEAAAVRTARPRIFYGWYVVAGLALVSLVSVSMAGINFGFDDEGEAPVIDRRYPLSETAEAMRLYRRGSRSRKSGHHRLKRGPPPRFGCAPV